MIKRIALTLSLYLLGLVLFPISWIREQKSAAIMAYWNTLGPAHHHVIRIWKKK